MITIKESHPAIQVAAFNLDRAGGEAGTARGGASTERVGVMARFSDAWPTPSGPHQRRSDVPR